ncbi:MAG: helicase-associated domain-containing protein [Sphaerochaetaceae bacterium]|nr:helicase-associated domain-containing protein [Sphaerochaetaceae bacterium]
MNELDSQALWERSLATLSDAVFLTIMRNYLGNIPTPFHKPQLIKRLTTLFSNDEFLNRLFSVISPQDVKILSAASILEAATQDQLCTLFLHDLPYLQVQQNIVNLEERLLLIPHPESSQNSSLLMVNPMLSKRLREQGCFSLRALLGPQAERAGSVHFSIPFDRRIVRALLSIHVHERVPVAERGQRFFRSQNISSIFSAYNQESIAKYLPMLERMLIRNGVVREIGKEMCIHFQTSKEFLELSQHKLRLFILCELAQEMLLFKMNQNDHDSLSHFFTSFSVLATCLDTISDQALYKIIYISAAKYNLQVQRYHDLIDLLTSAGILSVPVQDGQTRVCSTILLEETDSTESHMDFSCTIDSDFTITFSGEPVLDNGLDIIHMIAKVEKIDTVCTYRFSRESFRQAIDHGFSIKTATEFLESLSSQPLPVSLRNLLRHWGDESNSVRIYDGIAVCVDERIARLIDALPSLEPYKIAVIVPGIYLFTRKNEGIWRSILSEAAAVLLGQSISEETITSVNTGNMRSIQITYPDIRPLRQNYQALMQVDEPNRPTSSAFVEDLHKRALSLKISKYDLEELHAKIDKHLILTPQQIVEPTVRSGPMSASGFDVQGKLNLIRSAVASTSEILELHIVDDDGLIQKMMVEAKELIGNNRDYTLRVAVLPERLEKVIQADKIFLVRKLRRSIFF